MDLNHIINSHGIKMMKRESHRENIGERSEPSGGLGRCLKATPLFPLSRLPLGSLRLPICFFRPRQFFSPFPPNAEPGPRLTPNRPYGYQPQELRLDLTVKYFFVNLHVHVPGNASIRTCTATFLVCDFSISDLGFLFSSRSFPLGHIASFSSSR